MMMQFKHVWLGLLLFVFVTSLPAVTFGGGSCGGTEEPCCPDDMCDFIGLVCDTSTNTCENCGAQNELCCDNSMCGGFDLVCDPVMSRCVECGDDEELCCDGTTCNGVGECVNGICEVCGSADMPCCPGSQCDPGSICAPEIPCETVAGEGGGAGDCETLATGSGALEPLVCHPCGDLGELCCTGFQCDQGFICLSTATETAGMGGGAQTAALGECVNCGALGEVCCPGDACDDANLLCGATACESCGTIGEQCCANDTCPGSAAACVEGTCEALEPAPVMGGSVIIGLMVALTTIAALTLKRSPARQS